MFFVVLDYLEYVDDFMDRGATPAEVFGTYYLNYVPEIVRLTSPLAVFLAAIYVTGRLAQSLQLVALLSSGVSLVRIMVPFVLVGLLVTGFMFWFNGFVVPRTNGVVIEFQNQYYKKAPAQSETSQIHRQNRPGSVLSVGFFDRRTEQAYRVSLQDFEDAAGAPGAERVARRLDAESMQWVDSLGVWRMRGVTLRSFTRGGAAPGGGAPGGGAPGGGAPGGSGSGGAAAYAEVAELDTALQVLPRDLARTERDAERLTIPEARDYLDGLRRAGADQLGRPLVSYYGKFSYPVANLILVVIGVAMASVRRRGGQAVQFGTGLLVAFVYLALQKLSEPFGYAEAVPPVLVAWVPHALFAVFAVALVWHVRR